MENTDRVKKKFKFKFQLTPDGGKYDAEIECYPDEFGKALWSMYELEVRDIFELQEADIPELKNVGADEFIRWINHNPIDEQIDLTVLDNCSYRGWRTEVRNEASGEILVLIPPTYFKDRHEIVVNSVFQLNSILNIIRTFHELMNN